MLVFVDESGADSNVGIRKTAFSKKGVRPAKHHVLEEERRVNILPAITVDGVLDCWVYEQATNQELFERWLEESLLPKCSRYPATERSVVIMDNASYHRGGNVQRLFDEAGVVLIYLPPYSPDLNPIEEFFGELKQYTRRHYRIYESSPRLSWKDYLTHCVYEVGRKSMRGHFTHSGYQCEEREGEVL